MVMLPAVVRCAFALSALLVIVASGCDNAPTSPTESGIGVGYVKVSTPTTGYDVDDAFAVVSDMSLGEVTRNGSTVFRFPEGVHSIELKGIADNCVVDGAVVRSVSVKKNDTTLVVFSIHCFGGPPSGSIAFVDNQTLMVMKADASGKTPLTQGWQPSWSRNGDRIVYSATVCDDYGCTGSLEIVDPKTRQITPLPKTPAGVNPAWSPVDDLIAYTNIESGELYLYDIGKDTAMKVAFPTPVYVYHPSWSPDGTRMIAQCYAESFRGHLCVFNRDGTNVRDLLPGGVTEDSSPSWSPDGSRIVFVQHVGRSMMVVINSDGSSLHSLPVNGEMPSWSPDSRKIVFSDIDGIFSINSDGNSLTQITTAPRYSQYSPVWTR